MLLIGSLLFHYGCHADRKTIVAEVAGQEITADAFAARYKAYLGEVNGRDNILMRKQILDNMINEELVAADVERQGLDRDSLGRKRMEEIHTQAILLGYAKHITLDTMAVTEEELQKEFTAYNTRAAARYVYAQTEEDAWKLKDALEQGATFDSLAKEIFQDPGLANNGGYLGFFGWGDMEPGLEEAAFSLPIGEFSDPIKLSMGYAVVKVENRVRQPLASEYDYAKVKDKLAGALQKRKVFSILHRASEKVRSELQPSFHTETLDALVRALDLDGKTRLVADQIEVKTQSLLALPLITFKAGTWTVEDFLRKLRTTTERQQKRLRTAEDLKEFVVGLAIRDVTLQRAEETHVEKDSTVQEQIDRLRNEFILKRWKNSIEDTVGHRGWDEALLRQRYAEKKSEYFWPAEINVGEILLRSRSEAVDAMKKLRHGANFADLARKKSIRVWAAKRGGELGYGPKATYGILGDTLFTTPVGQLIGPAAVDPYFGIFKVLGKHESKPKSFEEARDQIGKETSSSKTQEALKSALDRLRSGAGITINEEVLSNVEIH